MSSPKSRLSLILFIASSILLVQSVAAESPRLDNPAQGLFSDDWAAVYFSGQKSGYAHSTMIRDGDLIRTSTMMKLRIGRAGITAEVGLTQGTTETIDGIPVSFESVMEMSAVKMITKGTIKDGNVTVVSEQFGMAQTQTVPFPKGALMTWGAYRESIKRGFEPGTTYTTDMYAPELRLDAALPAKTVVGDWEEFQHLDKKRRGQKVTVTMESPAGPMALVSWVDTEGKPLKAKMPLATFELELLTTDQKTALADFVAPEMFMTTVLKVPPIEDRAKVESIRYRLTSKTDASAVTGIPTTTMQSVTKQDNRVVELAVTRLNHKSKPNYAKPPAELADFLSANAVLNISDQTLIDLGKRAAGGEQDLFKLADRLRRFVTDYVEDKSMDVGFASASEVARNKSGDCSEHGVLLAALGRVAGFPSRVVVGLAYAPVFGGQSDIFGFHMWTQFWIDGQWVDVDAALRETECSPARIALATSSLKDCAFADLNFAVLSKIGTLDLEILEVKRIPDAPPTP